jgi:hypothetical protein
MSPAAAVPTRSAHATCSAPAKHDLPRLLAEGLCAAAIVEWFIVFLPTVRAQILGPPDQVRGRPNSKPSRPFDPPGATCGQLPDAP